MGCIGGLLLLTLFYFTAIPTTGLPQAGAEGTYLLVNKTLIEGLAVLALFAFDTGRIAGLDRLWAERRALSAGNFCPAAACSRKEADHEPHPGTARDRSSQLPQGGRRACRRSPPWAPPR